MARGEHIAGTDDVSGHLAEDAGRDPADLTEESPPADDRTGRLAEDAGVTDARLRRETGEDEEPSGLADFGQALAPPD